MSWLQTAFSALKIGGHVVAVLRKPSDSIAFMHNDFALCSDRVTVGAYPSVAHFKSNVALVARCSCSYSMTCNYSMASARCRPLQSSTCPRVSTVFVRQTPMHAVRTRASVDDNGHNGSKTGPPPQTSTNLGVPRAPGAPWPWTWKPRTVVNIIAPSVLCLMVISGMFPERVSILLATGWVTCMPFRSYPCYFPKRSKNTYHCSKLETCACTQTNTFNRC